MRAQLARLLLAAGRARAAAVAGQLGHPVAARAAAAPSISGLMQPFTRGLASSPAEYQTQVDDINEMFAEAREYIEDAKEDAETVYFNDSAAEAKEYTNAVLDKWRGLLSSLPEEERARLQRSMGLKMEQLKAELEQLDHLHA